MQFLRQQWELTQSKRLCVATLAMTVALFSVEGTGIIVIPALKNYLSGTMPAAGYRYLSWLCGWYSGRPFRFLDDQLSQGTVSSIQKKR